MSSKFEKLLTDLGTDETYTKPIEKEKHFNHVKDSVALIVGNNQQIDICIYQQQDLDINIY